MSDGEISTRFKSDPIEWMEETHVEDFQFVNEDFSGMTIRDKHFTSGDFIRCNFENTKIANCTFGGVCFIECNLNRTGFDAGQSGFTFFDKHSVKPLNLTE